jgi:glycosyltransferase involved in cell wall biosynthesis
MLKRLLTSQAVLWSIASTLYLLASLRRSNPRKDNRLRRVVHISPNYFSDSTYIGGGERYPTALAEAMAEQVETILISFGNQRHSFRQGRCQVEVYPAIQVSSANLISYSFLHELVKADVIHCHQYETIVTNFAILVGSALGKRVFVTDHGGSTYSFTDKLPLFKLVDHFLLVSAFSAKMLPTLQKFSVIYGGISERFISENKTPTKDLKVLYVGRLLPHKGINHLIEAIDSSVQLEIIGRVYDKTYFSKLKEISTNKSVRFVTNASDDEIMHAYSNSLVTVLPSVYIDVNGNQHVAPELLGLVLLESMGCGTPVICTDVGGMPEIVEDGVTGFIVPPNDPQTLGNRINYLIKNPEIAFEMGQRGRQKVLREFTWKAVVDRCLNTYRC